MSAVRKLALASVVTLCASTGGLVLASAPALAAGPEAPAPVVVEAIKATAATFRGELNPGKKGATGTYELGTYEFLYKKAATECEGGGKTPASPGISLGAGKEALPPQEVSGLEPHTEYTVCLLARDGTKGEATVGPAVTFTTATPPEAPTTGSATALTATTATLHGVLNPGAKGEAGSYEFLYNASESECAGGKTAPEPAGEAHGEEKEAEEAQLAGLAPNTHYTFCLLTRNARGETAVGLPVTFMTPVTAPAIASESALTVESTAATLQAEIVPDGAPTTYHFEYGLTSAYGQSTPESAPIGPDGLDHTATAALAGLQPGTTYHYRVVASNSQSPAGGSPGPDRTFTTPAAPGSAPPQNCPNELLRAEQPYGLRLPECRAYEMVSPVEKHGNDATDAGTSEKETDAASRASASGDALVFTSHGSFAGPVAAQYENQFISRRGPEGWSTQSISPPFNDYNISPYTSPYESMIFTPELTKGISTTDASLVTNEASEAPLGQFEIYRADLASGTYQWVSKDASLESGEEETEPYSSSINWFSLLVPMGTSTDLSHVAFDDVGGNQFEQSEAYEWINGEVVPVSVTNYGEQMSGGTVGDIVYGYNPRSADAWNAVSSDGSRVFFTASSGQLYVRDNAERPQSPLASPEFSNGTGTVTAGSSTVTEITPTVVASDPYINVSPGSTEISLNRYFRGQFAVGQIVSGPGIPAGTKITAVARVSGTRESPAPRGIPGITITLSTVVTGTVEEIFATDPVTLAVGQKIIGQGIPLGTTIAAVAPGAVTLSAPATESRSGVGLQAGGGCTSSTDACTVELSASQRAVPDPHGPQQTRYWGASTDGSRVFFTSNAELTEDARTGPADNAANLYEYDLQSGKLTDLTVDTTDAEGAAVQGVVRISEDGSYVYFVARGDLGGEAKLGQENLYVSHGGGAPKFIAALANGDSGDYQFTLDDAALSADGTHLAFLSEQSLTGYDTEPAEPRECENRFGSFKRCAEIYLFDASAGSLTCVSCNPSGARPVGESSLGSPYRYDSEHRRQNFTEAGALIFQSSDALVPLAGAGKQNVYEYSDGHIYPLSDVASAYESFFLDASPGGNDVFFGTAAQLLPQDRDNRVDIYDARLGGGFPVSTSPPTCNNGDSCKPPPTPQPAGLGAPASATFSGVGNLAPEVAPAPAAKPKAKAKQCRKRHGKCVKRKTKRKAKRSTAHSTKGRK